MPHEERGGRAAILAGRRNYRSKAFLDLSRQGDGIEALRIARRRRGDHHNSATSQLLRRKLQ
jgi:hypothetical protein